MTRKGWYGESYRHRLAALKRKMRLRAIRRYDFPKKRAKNRYHFSVYVPSTTRRQKPVSRKEFFGRIRETQDVLNKKFLGTTKVNAEGSYTLKSGELIKEPVARVETYAKEKDYFKHDQDVKEWVKKKRKQWGQQSIGVSIEHPNRPDEELHFVK